MSYFRREDWTLFRSLGTLGQKAGVPQERLPCLVAKELADNALDAAGGCTLGRLKNGGLWVRDKGEGLAGSDEEIASLFSVNRPLTSSKLLRLPVRGAVGNGLRVVAGVALASGGVLRIKTRGRILELAPRDEDGGTDVRRLGRWRGAGTKVEVRFGPALAEEAGLASVFRWAKDAIGMAAGGAVYKGRTSAWWYDSDSFYELVQAAGERTVRDLVQEFDGCSGGKAGTIARAFRGCRCETLAREDSESLLVTMRQHSKRVSPRRLGFVGADFLGEASYTKAATSFRVEAARGGVDAHVPCVVEVWAIEADVSAVVANINRTPITSDVWLTEMQDPAYRGLSGCGLSSERRRTATPVKLGRNRHFVFVVNITTPYMQITSDGKAPDLSCIGTALAAAMSKAVRRARRRRADAGKTTQKRIIIKALPEAIAEASGNGRFRYSLRRLFYRVRPRLLEALKQEPLYGTFCQVIRDHEAELGHDLHGIYRDDRGTLYHPHLRQDIPLGTRTVEQYERPEWTFNKILYMEKEGLYPMLRDAQWPERNDCALLTSKGFATRAARDVIDLLGDTEEELTFFCIHDADAPGTVIYQSLTEATRARPKRRVRIINLGLEPKEGREMGLPIERIKRKKRAAPVADYVGTKDRRWLQTHRIELDAMEIDEFLEWLDEKMEPYVGKLIPPLPVARSYLEDGIRDRIRARLTREAVRDTRVDERTDAALAARLPRLDSMQAELLDMICGELDENPEDSWRAPADRLADELANEA